MRYLFLATGFLVAIVGLFSLSMIVWFYLLSGDIEQSVPPEMTMDNTDISNSENCEKCVGANVAGSALSVESPGDGLLGKCLEFHKEYQKLLKGFTSIAELVIREYGAGYPDWDHEEYTQRAYPHRERWEREYYQPLQEKTQKLLAEIFGIDDHLALWENNIPQTMFVFKDCLKREDDVQVYTAYRMNSIRAILNERRAEILRGTRYEGTVRSNIIIGGWYRVVQHVDEQLNAVWDIMAIYSFKNDRARDLLFDIATRPTDKDLYNNRCDPLADWAVYYLSLFPNSGELLPQAKSLLKEAITGAKENYPGRAKHFLNGSDNVINPFNVSIYVNPWINGNLRLLRLARLVRSLEFNEKIPVEERERFDLLRREMAISWALCNKASHIASAIKMVGALEQGYEHFEIYFLEYEVPEIPWGVLWVNDDFLSPDWQKRRTFWEHELAHPRPFYTERQMEYLKVRTKNIEDLERQSKN